MILRPVPSLALLFTAAAALPGAETPIGLVERMTTGGDGTRLVLAFDAAGTARLAPGQLVAIYGPGAVEKHPLTGEVMIDRPRLVAKAQIIALQGGVTARLRWTAPGSDVQPGLDAVALINEPTPNAPPALTAAIAPQAAPLGTAVVLKLPLTDPDGDPLLVQWRLDGPAGAVGRLAASATAEREVTWLAPAVSGSATLAWTARDPWGQACSGTIPLVVQAGGDRHAGTLKPLARTGPGIETALAAPVRDARGSWWGLADGQLLRSDAGWSAIEPIRISGDQTLKKPAALATRGDELFVLDPGRGQVLVLGLDGALKKSIDGFSAGTALAVAPDGTLFVADTDAKTVHLVEADGSYRGRLGRPGPGKDGFQAVTALACDLQGSLYVLDATAGQVAVFDRFQRRLGSWPIPADDNDAPVAIAAHPKGLLVVRRSGALVVLGEKGPLQAQRPAIATLGLIAGVGPCNGVAVDLLGGVLLSFSDGTLQRLTPDLESAGVRASRLREAQALAADATGRLVVLDDGTLRRFDGEGWCTAVLPAPGRKPSAIAFQPDGNAIAVLDPKSCTVTRIAGAADSKVIGAAGNGPGQFSEPVDLAIDEAGRIYVLDADRCNVTVFAANGDLRFTFGVKGEGKDQLSEPQRVAIAPDGTTCWIYDADLRELKRFALNHVAGSATHQGTVGSKGTSAPGQFKTVVGLGIDRSGLVYVLDDSREDLQILDLAGSTLQPVVVKPYAELGLGSVGMMGAANAMAVSPDGWVTVAGQGKLTSWRW